MPREQLAVSCDMQEAVALGQHDEGIGCPVRFDSIAMTVPEWPTHHVRTERSQKAGRYAISNEVHQGVTSNVIFREQ